jgi:hypothetical protein
MTIKTDLQDEKAALVARLSVINAELDKDEEWLGAEVHTLEAWVKTKYESLFPAKVAAAQAVPAAPVIAPAPINE